jgi:hypothetical protein
MDVQTEDMEEESSQDLSGGAPSDNSWRASQGLDDAAEVNVNKEQLFLISLGAIMSLFT